MHATRPPTGTLTTLIGRDRALPILPARPMLHAARLSFTHPILGTPLTFERPPHADMLALLHALQGNTCHLPSPLAADT